MQIADEHVPSPSHAHPPAIDSVHVVIGGTHSSHSHDRQQVCPVGHSPASEHSARRHPSESHQDAISPHPKARIAQSTRLVQVERGSDPQTSPPLDELSSLGATLVSLPSLELPPLDDEGPVVAVGELSSPVELSPALVSVVLAPAPDV